MKPSYNEQRKNAPATDQKFREDDEHLLARNKEDVALSPHGDTLIPQLQKDEERKDKHRETHGDMHE